VEDLGEVVVGGGKRGSSEPNIGEGVSGGECGVGDERRIHWEVRV